MPMESAPSPKVSLSHLLTPTSSADTARATGEGSYYGDDLGTIRDGPALARRSITEMPLN